MNLDDTLRSHILLELMDCVDDLVLILDSRLHVVEANRVASIIFGYPAGDLVTKSLPDLIDSGERERIARLIQDTKERRGGETVFFTRSHRKIPASFSLSPLSGAGPKQRGYLLTGHLADKSTHEPKADASNGLAVRMLKGFADPLFIIDGASRTVRGCNDAALAAFCFTREEFVGHLLLDHAQNAEERQRYRALEARVDKTFATAGIFQERVLFPRKDLPPLPCDCTGLPFFRPDGSLDTIIIMLFDRAAEEERKAELAHLIGQVSNIAAEFAAIASDYSACGKSKRLSDLGFTPRQIEIARLGASGASSKEIGFRLGIAESTVKNHLAVMYRKLGVNSRICLIRALSAKRIKIE
jgi:PAS domain S-box-containing protein